MFGKMFSKFSLIAIIFLVFMMFGTANAVKLTDTISTGMSVQEVKEQVDLNLYMEYETSKVFTRTDEPNALYVFNIITDELVYKIVSYPMESWDGMMDGFVENIGDPIQCFSKDNFKTYFWNLDDDGGIMMLNDFNSNEIFYFWYGSISLWNELADQEIWLDTWPKE